MKYGFWLPIFGGWLRNVEDENMPPTFDYAKQVIQSAEEWGYSTTLIAELYLNDIKGPEHDSLEAWTTAAALASVTEKIEIMAAVRPGFHNPAITAKMAANIDQISNGRFTLNVVSAWWEEEARQYGGIFTEHDERYERTTEFIDVLKGLWSEDSFSYEGKFYQLKDTKLFPKPVQRPNPILYAGGESEKGKQTIVEKCDAYVMHGGTVQEIEWKITDMKNRRLLRQTQNCQSSEWPPTSFAGIQRKRPLLNWSVSRMLKNPVPMPALRISQASPSLNSRFSYRIIRYRTVVCGQI
ncbi:coenzyme F420-dependent N5,N10-methylene tetrahydromethanopterin reductase [Mesobacillus boroniphilus JCM 21738]|uniref:Coenzyme F420-dependent N5,N10-methylene tetrahydromethanopterin reductase n=1 Tax=Mesobacillus boroniphilus JCM 21738 TaxID=1294265 RepID=W4RK46_9BACI|nr:coenzyme F420-dependent N5,N10-methylene tetrahydromethanopterin reductase [Mesobacillus boroniphilus JCM 21738]